MTRLDRYSTLIVDMDGTLYFQPPLRIAMLFMMALRPWRIREFLILRNYRRLYAEGRNKAERLALLPKDAEKIADEWMVKRPLRIISRFADRELISALEAAREKHIRVAVYSDYPVTEKLQALGFSPNEAYCADELGTMKPDHTGIVKAMGISSTEGVLVIGDRDDKDGQMARGMGCDCLILSKMKNARRKQYKI